MLETRIAPLRPSLIINLAAIADVDKCEEYPILAYAVNSHFANGIARIAKNIGSKFVHLSTDMVFDGTIPFATEDTKKNPINIYGLSKSLGEDLVRKTYPDALIVRTNFFGWGPPYRKSFSDWIIESLRSDKVLHLDDERYYSPILLNSLYKGILEAVEGNISGLIHLSGPERVSKYQFAVRLSRVFSLRTELVRRLADGAPRENRVARPKDLSLDCTKARNEFNFNPLNVCAALEDLKRSKFRWN